MFRAIHRAGNLILLSLFLLGCRTQPAQFAEYPDASPQGEDDQNVLIRAGDIVEFEIGGRTVYRAKVQEDGSIILLLNQRFVAAGKTIQALDREINDRYLRCFAPGEEGQFKIFLVPLTIPPCL